MSDIREVSIAARLSAAMLFACAMTPAHALMVQGDITTGEVKTAGGAMADFSLCAYSVQSAPEKIGPNAKKSAYDSTAHADEDQPQPTQDDQIAAVDCGKTITVGGEIKKGVRTPARSYAPSWGIKKRDKPALTSSQGASSTSGEYQGQANQFIDSDRKKPITLEVRGLAGTPETIGPDDIGEAAGEAIDPYAVVAGIYDYAPEIHQIRLDTDTDRDFAGLSFYALDSRYADPLWLLEIGIDGVLASASDLHIRFQSNPLARIALALVLDEAGFAVTMSG